MHDPSGEPLLAACVRRAVGASPLDAAVVDRIVQQCIDGRLRIDPGSDGSQGLMRAMEPLRRIVTDEALTHLDRVSIAAVPIPVSNALAVAVPGRSYILLFDGILNSVLAGLEMSHAISSMPAVLADTYPSRQYPDVSALSLVSVYFGGLLNRYSRWAEPLPNFRPLVNAERGQILTPGFQAAVWWLILHELGHLTLEHTTVDGEAIRPSLDRLIVSEALSVSQLQELEADDFAFACLKPSYAGLHNALINIALHPQMLADSLVSLRGDEHPLTVNRLHRALELARGGENFVTTDDMEAHLRRPTS